MAYVVTADCILCKHTDCVSTCPVDCFYEGENFLVINPEECIDCGMCEPECPIGAIKTHDNLSKEEEVFLELNRELSLQWPSITAVKSAMPDADKWAGKPGKLELLKR